MTALRIIQTPELNEPTNDRAFAGWSDAGGAATAAAQYLIDRWHATACADFEAEDFYDFTQLRPTVRWEGEERRIDWPENAFYYHQHRRHATSSSLTASSRTCTGRPTRRRCWRSSRSST